MILIRFIFSLFTYIVFYFLIKIPFSALGLFLVPLMALFWRYTTKTEISVINGREILNWKHKFMFIWGNNEDGIMGAEEFKNSSNFVRIVYWSAYRNPANNLRFVPYITCKINPSKVNLRVFAKVKDLNGNILENYSRRDLDRDSLRYTTLIWQGLYSNLRIQFKMFGKIWRFWIGWKIYAHDIFGTSPNDYRIKGAGFATQLKRIYPRNK